MLGGAGGWGWRGGRVLLRHSPERLPAASLGQRGGRGRGPLLRVFPISGSQHGSADPGNAVQKLVEGVRPQQCCGELCCQIGFYYFIFSVKFMG